MGDRKGEPSATRWARRGLIGLCALLCAASTWAAESAIDRSRHYDIHLPRESVASALNGLSEQTGIPVVFPYDLVANRLSTPVSGRYTLREVLQELLRGTGLSGGLSDRGVLTVAAAPVETIPGELQVQKSQSNPSEQNNDAQGARQIHPGHWAILFAGVAAAFGAYGQNIESSANASNASDLTEIVVTAQKRTERLQDVPISISVLSGNDLDRSTFADTKDALATLPGVATFTDQESGATVLSVRGVSSTGALFSGSTPVAYYMDGVPFALVRSAIVPDADIYDLQRIEVLNGPQGTLYGASALNGVVRILTNDPDLQNFDFKGRASTSNTYRGEQNYDGDMAVNIPIVSDKLALRVVAGDEHLGGWIDSLYGNHINYTDVGTERAKLEAQPTDTLSIELSAWHSQVQSGGTPQANSDYFIPETHGQPESNSFDAYGLKVQDELQAFDITSVTSYLVYANRSVLDLSPVDFDFNLLTDLHSRVISEEINLTSKTDGPWKWSGGFFYRDARDTTFQSDTLFPQPPAFGDEFIDTSKSEAIYGEVGRRIGDQLEVSAGARYFHDEEGTQPNVPPQLDIPNTLVQAASSATTPRVVLTWKPNTDFTGYLSYGQGFRSGFPQDYLVQSRFPPVEPDKLTNYELGIKGNALDQRLVFTAATYFIHWTGVQQSLRYYPPDGISEVVVANAQAASGPGAEFSVIARPINGFDLNATFSWNDLTYDHTVYSALSGGGTPIFLKGDRLDVSPEFTGSLAASYEFSLGSSGFKGQISASENYTSVLNSVDINLGAAANKPSNSLLIARAKVSVIAPAHWTVTLFADNLTNYNGNVVADPSSAYYNTRATPRTVGVSVDYHLR